MAQLLGWNAIIATKHLMRAMRMIAGLTILMCVLGYEVNSKLSFSAPFKSFTYSGTCCDVVATPRSEND